jgi:cytochrome c553
MIGRAAMIGEFGVTWRLALIIGLLAGLAPTLAYAQTNIDQGKTAAQIFATDCAECHKAARGLANGKNSAALADFLREHYTTSREQAAALAAYVLGGRGSEPSGATGQGKKPAAERASASAEEPKRGKNQKPGKPDEGISTSAKPQRPTEAEPKEEATPSDIPGVVSPIIRPEGGQRDNRPATASRNRAKEPKTPEPPPEPAAVAHAPPVISAEPARPETPTTSPEQTPKSTQPAASAAAPGDSESGENAPVPRDNIPD